MNGYWWRVREKRIWKRGEWIRNKWLAIREAKSMKVKGDGEWWEDSRDSNGGGGLEADTGGGQC